MRIVLTGPSQPYGSGDGQGGPSGIGKGIQGRKWGRRCRRDVGSLGGMAGSGEAGKFGDLTIRNSLGRCRLLGSTFDPARAPFCG
jgi:hypothetical protein